MLRKVNNYCIFVGSEWKPPLIKPELEVIEFVLFGLDLLEPNVLITDALLGLLSALFALKISRLSAEHTFFKRWQLFLLMFGIGTFLGGIGHAFYNYLDLAGKVPSWIFATFSVYFIEQSMLSIYPHRRRLKLLRQISGYKLAAVMIILGVLLTLSHPDRKIDYCMLAVILNSFIGVSLSAGLLGNYYYRLGYSSYFR